MWSSSWWDEPTADMQFGNTNEHTEQKDVQTPPAQSAQFIRSEGHACSILLATQAKSSSAPQPELIWLFEKAETAQLMVTPTTDPGTAAAKHLSCTSHCKQAARK
jgi:hypothetical protein